MKKLIDEADRLCAEIDEERKWSEYARKFVSELFKEYIKKNNLTKSEELLLNDLKHEFNIKLLCFGMFKLDEEE